jgi:hypothetical protein
VLSTRVLSTQHARVLSTNRSFYFRIHAFFFLRTFELHNKKTMEEVEGVPARVTATLADGTKVQVIVDDFALVEAENSRKLAEAAEKKEKQKAISAAKKKAFKANQDILEPPLPTYAELPEAKKQTLIDATVVNLMCIGKVRKVGGCLVFRQSSTCLWHW